MRATGKLAAVLWVAAAAAGPARAQWLERPSAGDVSAVYPQDALTNHIPGRAVLSCRVQVDGSLSDCQIQLETPVGHEFGTAALKLAPKFRLDLTSDIGRKAVGRRVGVPLTFGDLTAGGPPRRAARFKTPEARFAWLAPAGPYWPDRAERAGVGGFGVVDCQVGEDLRLKDCKLTDYSLPNMGFGDSVMKMAEQGWMTAAPLAEGETPPPDGIWRFEVDFPARSLSGALRR